MIDNLLSEGAYGKMGKLLLMATLASVRMKSHCKLLKKSFVTRSDMAYGKTRIILLEIAARMAAAIRLLSNVLMYILHFFSAAATTIPAACFFISAIFSLPIKQLLVGFEMIFCIFEIT